MTSEYCAKFFEPDDQFIVMDDYNGWGKKETISCFASTFLKIIM
jgi:hypothetical protein